MDEKKSGIFLALGAKPKTEEADDEEDDITMAAGDLLAAIKSGNAKDLAEAFTAMSELCSYGPKEDEE